MEEQNVMNAVEARINQLEQTAADKDVQITESLARINTLETALKERESELEESHQEAGDLQAKLALTTGELTKAVISYRTLAVKANPGIAEDLISGNTIEAVDASLVKAQKLTDRIRQELEKEGSRLRVPVGAPGRVSNSMTELSAREKINYGIGGKK